MVDGFLERADESGDLFDQVSALIDRTRAAVAGQANVALTLVNWMNGRLINTEVLGADNFSLDLLSYSCPLRRLIAVGMKVVKFGPSYKGQMDLYLRWLNRYERRDDEEAPLRLILCTETSREQIELLEMHKDGIMVAEYWAALPPKEELQRRTAQIHRAAQEQVARRAIGPARDYEDIE